MLWNGDKYTGHELNITGCGTHSPIMLFTSQMVMEYLRSKETKITLHALSGWKEMTTPPIINIVALYCVHITLAVKESSYS